MIKVMMDIDGVLRNWVAQVHKVYARQFGVFLPDHTMYNGLYDDMVRHSGGHIATVEDAKRWLYSYNVEELYTGAQPFWDMWEAAQQIRSKPDEYELWLVTKQPNEDCLRATYEWILRYSLLPKGMVQSSRKWEVPADFYIEDNPDIAAELVNMSIRGHVCLYDQPYNRYMSNPYIYRIHTGQEFLNFIKSGWIWEVPIGAPK